MENCDCAHYVVTTDLYIVVASGTDETHVSADDSTVVYGDRSLGRPYCQNVIKCHRVGGPTLVYILDDINNRRWVPAIVI